MIIKPWRVRLRWLQVVPTLLLAVLLSGPLFFLFHYAIAEPERVERIVASLKTVAAEQSLFTWQIDLREFARIGTQSNIFATGFLNSLLYSLASAGGQLLFAFPAALFLALFPGKAKRILLPLYLILMLLPFQATVVPTYLTLDELNLLDHAFGIILPQWFLPFSVVMLYLFLIQIPADSLEAAKVDGASFFHVVRHMVIPLTRNGVGSILLLQLIDSWNMLEQPLFFLESQSRMPLAILIRQSLEQAPSESFGPSLLFLLPALAVYVLFYPSIVTGMQSLFQDGRKKGMT
ncbi:carbohydrate ABC transporter permease [Gorillibacterium sp. sgz500922]|uniref:carbohydrate ABC transporter permease n=1 Tax=Gorillibacterium sp. sgz500922 TaxID=3446694 RepID=UPI003F678BF6